MEFGDLLEIRELLQYQHVIGAVVCLGERPMRYGELGSAITEWTGSRIGDGEVTRTVHRLVGSGLADETYAQGHRLLVLTAAGMQRLDTIRALGRALRRGNSRIAAHSAEPDHIGGSSGDEP
ncbi:hypothetical protein ACFFX1_08360 [Dactylosporangium sucinum]|uniref:hypothetical protein n=1 Tax=Dactylosporangium sucinum TaxID=1424081 RepID=UPI00167DFA80|nr:hypothetical protein [Dactylosporangium sucinum]